MTERMICFHCKEPIESEPELSIGLYGLKPRPFHSTCHVDRLEKRSIKEKLLLGGPLNRRFLKDPRISKTILRLPLYVTLLWLVFAAPLFLITGSLYVLLLGFIFGMLLIMPLILLIRFVYVRMIRSVRQFEGAFAEQ